MEKTICRMQDEDVIVERVSSAIAMLNTDTAWMRRNNKFGNRPRSITSLHLS
jgi:hypothetical protein